LGTKNKLGVAVARCPKPLWLRTWWQCSRKRVQPLKKRKKSRFLDFQKKTLKNVKT